MTDEGMPAAESGLPGLVPRRIGTYELRSLLGAGGNITAWVRRSASFPSMSTLWQFEFTADIVVVF